MTERYSNPTLKIKALSNLSTLSTFNDAEIWDIVGRQGMNAAERGSFKLYASNAALLSALESNVGQVVTIYVTDQVASGAKMDLATFIIKNINTETGEGVSEVTVSGPELTDQLRNEDAGNNAIDDGAGGPSTTDVSTIMGYASAGWSLTGATATAEGTYHAARGDTVLKLLNAAAQQSGEIFRLATYADPSSKGLFWTASPDSSGVTLRMPSTYNQYDGSTTVGKLYSLRREFDFEPVISGLRPFGAGVGNGRLDITGIDSGDTGADPSWLDTTFASNLMVNTDLETALGYPIRTDIDFSWIQADDPTNATQLTSAAVALWKTAKNFLAQNDAAREFYTAVGNVAANLRPGQNVTLVYSEYQGGMTGGSQTININKTLTILSVENRFEEGERITTLTLGDKPLPQPTAAQWVADVAEKTQDTTRKSDVSTSSGGIPSSRTITTDLPVEIAGSTSADLSADRNLALRGLNGFGGSPGDFMGMRNPANQLEWISLAPGTGVASIVHTANTLTINVEVEASDLHSPVSLAADVAAILGLSGQQLTLDSQAANSVFAGPTSGGAADPTFRALVDADIPASIARDSELHNPITLEGSADSNLLYLTASQGLGLDSQNANTIFAGPTTGSANKPAFRSLVDADIPSSIARDSELHNQVHVLATTGGLGADHTVSGLTAGQVLRATGATTAAFGTVQHSELGGVSANQHHNQIHVLATTGGLGPDHSVSGLTAGQVLRATGAAAAAFGTLQHSELGGVSANQHHNQSHVLATSSALGPDHTVSGLTAGHVLMATGATSARFQALDLGSLPIFPSARVYRNVDTTIPNNSLTTISFTTERYDTNNLWSSSPNPTRLTAPETGTYLLTAHGGWSTSSGSGSRRIFIRRNGTTDVAAISNTGGAGSSFQNASVVIRVTAGDYFEMVVWQDSGGNLSFFGNAEYYATLSIARIG